MEQALIRNIITTYLHLEHNIVVDLWMRDALTRSDAACVLMNHKALAPTDAIKRQNSAMRKHVYQALYWMVCNIGDWR